MEHESAQGCLFMICYACLATPVSVNLHACAYAFAYDRHQLGHLSCSIKPVHKRLNSVLAAALGSFEPDIAIRRLQQCCLACLCSAAASVAPCYKLICGMLSCATISMP